ncbi:uncharacterized protein LOC119180070 isoform X5 [Rhipicephalus microplus]|uniref:uncharacterized protein LOC119180070 isoform X5 n=1 Tax=Rhipicephalus microplus TaxID=6941 RepID=UPI003F6B3178
MTDESTKKITASSAEAYSQNHRYLSNCVNLGSFLVTVMLITYLEQCSTTQLQNSTAAGRECWFNWTKIVDGQTHGLETPCNTTKPEREDGCERERHSGTYPECCKWVRAC